MDNIDDIFKMPNDIKHTMLRYQIIIEYKKAHDLLLSEEVNIAEVKEWARDNYNWR